MAWRIVKQPDGQYARFSDIVDNFTHCNMTRDEAVDLCHDDLGRIASEQKVLNADNKPERWEESLNTVRLIHGEEGVQKVLAEMMGLTEGSESP